MIDRLLRGGLNRLKSPRASTSCPRGASKLHEPGFDEFCLFEQKAAKLQTQACMHAVFFVLRDIASD